MSRVAFMIVPLTKAAVLAACAVAIAAFHPNHHISRHAMFSHTASINQRSTAPAEKTPLLNPRSSSSSGLSVEGVRNTPSTSPEYRAPFFDVAFSAGAAGALIGGFAALVVPRHESGDHDFGDAPNWASLSLSAAGGFAIGACVGAAGWAVHRVIKNCENSERTHSDVEAIANEYNSPPATLSESGTDNHRSNAVSFEDDEINNPPNSPASVDIVVSDVSERRGVPRLTAKNGSVSFQSSNWVAGNLIE